MAANSKSQQPARGQGWRREGKKSRSFQWMGARSMADSSPRLGREALEKE